MRRRPITALILLATVAGLLAAAATPALARNGRAETTAERHARVVAHWTPARLRSAVPRDFVRAEGKLRPARRPPVGGDGVTGASWANGGPVKARTGKVYFEMAGGAFVCSGSVADDPSGAFSLVLTAGHCAYDEANGEFATYWLFIPDFDAAPTFTCSQTWYGCWTADALVVHDGYASAGGFNDQATRFDFAFAVVRGGGKTGTSLQLDDATGAGFPVAIGGLALNERAAAFGYPAAGKYKGRDLVYCAGNVFEDALNGDDTWGMRCGMTGGSSGGPWLEALNESNGTGGALSSLNSYGYSGQANMYGPKFNADTSAVYQEARTGPTVDVIVGG